MATQEFELIEKYTEENVINLIREVEKIFDSENNLVYIIIFYLEDNTE